MEMILSLRKSMNKNRKLSFVLMILYLVVFVGCAGFPIFNPQADYIDILIHAINATYLIPMLYLAYYGANKEFKVWCTTFLCLTFGMVDRYFLEFGEVSNTMNFNFINIITFIVVLPIIYTFVYHIYSKKEK